MGAGQPVFKIRLFELQLGHGLFQLFYQSWVGIGGYKEERQWIVLGKDGFIVLEGGHRSQNGVQLAFGHGLPQDSEVAERQKRRRCKTAVLGVVSKALLPRTFSSSAYAQLFKILEVFIDKRRALGGDEGSVGGAVSVGAVQKTLGAFRTVQGSSQKIYVLLVQSFKRGMPVVKVDVFHPPVGISADVFQVIHAVADSLAIFHAVKARERVDPHPYGTGSSIGQQRRHRLHQAKNRPGKKRQDADVPVHVPLSPIEACASSRIRHR